MCLKCARRADILELVWFGLKNAAMTLVLWSKGEPFWRGSEGWQKNETVILNRGFSSDLERQLQIYGINFRLSFEIVLLTVLFDLRCVAWIVYCDSWSISLYCVLLEMCRCNVNLSLSDTKSIWVGINKSFTELELWPGNVFVQCDLLSLAVLEFKIFYRD